MADKRDNAQDRKKDDDATSQGSGGNAGAGKSGKEGMGSEKPSDDEGLGSQKPGGGSQE